MPEGSFTEPIVVEITDLSVPLPVNPNRVAKIAFEISRFPESPCISYKYIHEIFGWISKGEGGRSAIICPTAGRVQVAAVEGKSTTFACGCY